MVKENVKKFFRKVFIINTSKFKNSYVFNLSVCDTPLPSHEMASGEMTPLRAGLVGENSTGGKAGAPPPPTQRFQATLGS